ncbi:MAG: hypothetical protein Q9170_004796 [Blastenia crenularia]
MTLIEYKPTGMASFVKNVAELAAWLCQKGASLYQSRRAALPPGSKGYGNGISRDVRLAIHYVAAALRPRYLRKKVQGSNVIGPRPTFGSQALGLRHTCCKYDDIDSHDFETLGPEEIQEIREEDHENMELLESILLEFEDKLGDEDLKGFLGGFWKTRMEEVIAARENEILDVVGLREAGVIIYEDAGAWIDEGSDNGDFDYEEVDDDNEDSD